jgi:hypothetical protein
MADRVTKAIRALTEFGCPDCSVERLCAKHERIDAHIRHIKARKHLTWVQQHAISSELNAAVVEEQAASAAYIAAVQREREEEHMHKAE